MTVLKKRTNELLKYTEFLVRSNSVRLRKRMEISVTKSLLFLRCLELYLQVLANLLIRSSAVPYTKPDYFGYDKTFQILSRILRWEVRKFTGLHGVKEGNDSLRLCPFLMTQ
jgi:uncharacterized membrane protein